MSHQHVKIWALMPFLEPQDLVEVAREAERCGFEGVALADHASNPETIRSKYPYGERRGTGQILTSPLVTIGALATVTSRLRFTTWVLVVPLRHPILLAKDIATAVLLSGGRLELGIGIGWMHDEFEALGVEPTTRATRMEEMVEIMTRLWRGEFVEWHTEHFDFEPNQVLPALASPPPLLVGGHARPALRRAARIADGWTGAFPGHDELAGIVDDLSRERAAAGREGRFEIRVSFNGAPTDVELAALHASGATSVIVTPWHLAEDPTSLESIREGMRRFADRALLRT